MMSGGGQLSEGDRMVLRRALELVSSSMSGDGRARSSSSEAPGTTERMDAVPGRAADLPTTPCRAAVNLRSLSPGASKAV